MPLSDITIEIVNNLAEEDLEQLRVFSMAHNIPLSKVLQDLSTILQRLPMPQRSLTTEERNEPLTEEDLKQQAQLNRLLDEVITTVSHYPLKPRLSATLQAKAHQLSSLFNEKLYDGQPKPRP